MKLYYVLLHIFLLTIIFNSASAQTDSIDSDEPDTVFTHEKYGYRNTLLDSLKRERDWFDSVNTQIKDSLAIEYESDSHNNPSVLPVTYAIAGFLYLFNPIVLLDNDKIVGGITKEFSIGFGDLGENRISFEYSFLFREDSKSHYRISAKHDFLLKKDIRPSNLLQSTPVFTLGAGYFTDLKYSGIFPEVSYGFSIRNHKLLLYPHIKARYTFIFDSEHTKSGFPDLSLGFMIGIANPFIDTKIRRKY